MYETTAWRISCERGRTKWTETYYSATEESARAMIEFTYPGVVIHSIEPGGPAACVLRAAADPGRLTRKRKR
jgi:hypothetical protein